MAPHLERDIATVFRGIPEVESVYITLQGGDSLKVCTVVNEEDDSVYNAIYDHELAFLRSHPSARIDFNTVTRHNRPIEEFLGKKSPAWERTVVCEGRQASQLG
ncbi:MAG: hypothetical protein ACRD3O_10190 [Terriglobia bacterium]